VVGWVENTPRGSVRGEVQGDRAAALQMKHWLANTGSPSSRIDRAVFTDEREGLAKLDYKTFDIRR
jgi:acylphosphatase